MTVKRVCIIGAGAAGIAAANAISRVGLAFDWFEAGSQLGGIWRYGNDTGSSVYASLMTNTSQVNMEWFGYPMPKRTNDYLTHVQVLDYLARFVAHASLENKITFSTRVSSVEPLPEGGFRVTVKNASGAYATFEYAAVVVSVGCHSKPKWPKLPGVFNGRTMHASEYRIPQIFAGQRVVIAGFGASGVDITCDASDVAKSVTLSTRSGGYVLPRYVGGKPRDESSRPWIAVAPLSIRKQMWRIMLKRRTVPPKVRVALESRAAPFAKPAVINDRLADLIDNDRVVVKPAIQKCEADRVIFADGTCVICDLLVCATGYEVAHPLFSSEVAEQNGSFLDRYLRVIPPNQPGLYFVGAVSVVGPFFPTLERQATWVADLVSGKCNLTNAVKMRQLAANESRRASMSYTDAGRGGDTVEYHSYIRALKKEQAAGQIRRKRGTGVECDGILELDNDRQLVA